MKPDEEKLQKPVAGMWKHPRDDAAALLQLKRRHSAAWVSFLHEEVQTRMLERSEVMRPVQGAVLDVSLGRHDAAQRLALRFPDRTVNSVHWLCQPAKPATRDPVRKMLRSISSGFGFSKVASGPSGVVSLVTESFQRMPLLPVPCAMVWSNGLLHRVNQPTDLLSAWHARLAAGGALFFSCLGPDTGQELRDFAAAQQLTVPDYADMHDWGDLVLKAGFSDPVMEMEKIVLTYTDPLKMIQDWHQLEGNNLRLRSPGLRGRALFERFKIFLNEKFEPPYRLTVEVIYGHAWRVEKKNSPQEFTIPIEKIGRKP